MQHYSRKIGDESEKFGLKVSIPKPKYMMVTSQNQRGCEELKMRDEVIEKVDLFVYLGSKITAEDVNRRLALV